MSSVSLSLHGKTINALEDLEEADWFANVGKPIFGDCKRAISWAEASRYTDEEKWEDVTREEQNRITTYLNARHKALFQKWNEHVQGVRPLAEALVEKKLGPFEGKFNLSIGVRQSVRWDILSYLMECEYSDVCEPGFFSNQADWYLAGRFPCGWDGDYFEIKDTTPPSLLTALQSPYALEPGYPEVPVGRLIVF